MTNRDLATDPDELAVEARWIPQNLAYGALKGFRRILLEEFWALTDKTTIAAKKTIGKWNLIPPNILFLFGHRKPSKSAVKC